MAGYVPSQFRNHLGLLNNIHRCTPDGQFNSFLNWVPLNLPFLALGTLKFSLWISLSHPTHNKKSVVWAPMPEVANLVNV
jgi:hypothetical protein